MRTIKIDDKDADDIITALGMRLCQIETGTTTMRAIDAQQYNAAWRAKIPDGVRTRMGQAWCDNPNKKIEIRALTREQRDLINRLEDLITELRK